MNPLLHIPCLSRTFYASLETQGARHLAADQGAAVVQQLLRLWLHMASSRASGGWSAAAQNVLALAQPGVGTALTAQGSAHRDLPGVRRRVYELLDLLLQRLQRRGACLHILCRLGQPRCAVAQPPAHEPQRAYLVCSAQGRQAHTHG